LLGYAELEAYMKQNHLYNKKLYADLKKKNYKKKNIRSYINDKNKHLATDDVIDLLERIFKYDP